MNYLDLQEKLNLEIASEYLVMASELIELKSKLLLPNVKNEEGEEEDPREELVNRLLEYQAYKEITKVFQDKENLRKEIYTKSPENIRNYIEENTAITTDVTLDDYGCAKLIKAYMEYRGEVWDDEKYNIELNMADAWNEFVATYDNAIGSLELEQSYGMIDADSKEKVLELNYLHPAYETGRRKIYQLADRLRLQANFWNSNKQGFADLFSQQLV